MTVRGAAPTLTGVGPDRSLDSDLNTDGATDELCFADGDRRIDADAGVVVAGGD